MGKKIKKEIYLDELPRWTEGRYKDKINWRESIGHKIKFIYDDIEGELPILNYIKIKNVNYIVTEYRENKNYYLSLNSLYNCGLANLLGKTNHEYKYNTGDIINITEHNKIKILGKIRISNGRKNETQRGYKYECLVCKNIDTILEQDLINGQGCNVCSGKKVLKGINDLWTTHPNIAKMLKYPEIGYTISHGVSKREIFLCPNCGQEKDSTINNVTNNGFYCYKCGDGITYPEKFMLNILEQLNINFKKEKIFKWFSKKRYDFYFKLNNEEYIIETNGLQHYEERTEKSNFKQTLKEEQENDRLKKKLALKNGIKEENYIVIDCRYSELEWIKDHILSSKLNDLFDLSKIDWLECHKFACNSLVKTICDLWNSGIQDVSKISKITNLNKNTIRKYLKQGQILSWCSYNVEIEIKKRNNALGESRKRKVICITTNTIYESIHEAEVVLGIHGSSISNCCLGKKETAGKSINGEKLLWKYI